MTRFLKNGMANPSAAQQAGFLVLEDYLQRRNESAFCQYLRFMRGRPFGFNPVLNNGWERLCEPFDDDPPPPPEIETFEAGGVACRLYRVQYVTGSAGQPPNPSFADRRGPIRLLKVSERKDDNFFTNYWLISGDGVNCPIVKEILAGSQATVPPTVYCRLTGITPLEGDGTDEIPIPVPNDDDGTPTPQPPQFDIDVNIDGININIPVNFEIPVNVNLSPVIPFVFAPTANFNLPFDPSDTDNPRFGIDVDLDFVIELNDGTGNSNPRPDAEPIPIPRNDEPLIQPVTPIDLNAIEALFKKYDCCPSPNDSIPVGSFLFETPNEVIFVNLPSSTVGVVIELQPGLNTRVFKFSSNGSEYGFGNASYCLDGNSTEFFRLFVGKHVIPIPKTTQSKQLRLSCQQGVNATVRALLYVEEGA